MHEQAQDWFIDEYGLPSHRQSRLSETMHPEAERLVEAGEVPLFPEFVARRLCRQAAESGRVGKRRTDPDDVARILLEHGIYSGEGHDLITAQIAAMPSVQAALATYEKEDAPLRQRFEELGVTHQRLFQIWEHPLGHTSDEEARALGVNLSRHVEYGRLWRAQEVARGAWRLVNAERLRQIAGEEAERFLQERETPSPAP